MQSGLKNKEATLEELSIPLELDNYNGGSSLCSCHKPVEFPGTRMMLDMNLDLNLIWTLIFRRLQLEHPA